MKYLEMFQLLDHATKDREKVRGTQNNSRAKLSHTKQSKELHVRCAIVLYTSNFFYVDQV